MIYVSCSDELTKNVLFQKIELIISNKNNILAQLINFEILPRLYL